MLRTETHPVKDWRPHDIIFLFHDGNAIQLWNITAKQVAAGWNLIENEKANRQVKKIVFEDVLSLGARLEKRVLGQSDAIDAVTQAIWNYSAGLKDPKQPIRVHCAAMTARDTGDARGSAGWLASLTP